MQNFPYINIVQGKRALRGLGSAAPWLGLLVMTLCAVALSWASSTPAGIDPGDELHFILGNLHLVPKNLPAFLELFAYRPGSFSCLAACCLCGAALGLAATLLQVLLRTPLVDPGLLGASSTASACAALMASWLLTSSWYGTLLTPLAASFGALAVLLTVVRLQLPVTALLVLGQAINLAGTLGSEAIVCVRRGVPLADVLVLRVGGVTTVSSKAIGTSAAVLLLVACGLALLRRPLQATALSDVAAGHLGFNLPRLRLAGLVCSAALIGTAVTLAGPQAFVGLLSGWLAQQLVGSSVHRRLPAAALLGATTVLLCDTLARSIASPLEVPVGLITGLVGAPLFIWLFLRHHAAGDTLP
jgi:iron complex transport system permease protein